MSAYQAGKKTRQFCSIGFTEMLWNSSKLPCFTANGDQLWQFGLTLRLAFNALVKPALVARRPASKF